MAKKSNFILKKSPTPKSRNESKGSRRTAELQSAGTYPDINVDDVNPSGEEFDSLRYGDRVFVAGSSNRKKKKNDILPDLPDIRDRQYIPHLRRLLPGIYPRIAFLVRNQGPLNSCTGHSLAHVVDFLRFREVSADNPARVSAQMLYEMAKRNDEWSGSAYEGSSVRGAIKGFFRNGVCTESTAPAAELEEANWTLTYEMAKEARDVRLGAYFRIQPDLNDYHAALNDVGVIYVSAQIHSNWDSPNAETGAIEPGGDIEGGHAFAIVGYDDSGFWILNSWGSEWGRGGIAHWSYDDWATNVMDAWVLQLGVRAPAAFGATPRVSPSNIVGFELNDPNRADIVGHFINIDDGCLITDGKYASPTAMEMQETVKRLTSDQSNKKAGYSDLVLYVHGGLNDLTDEARRIATWKRHDIFGRNKIYNFHMMWGSGFLDEAFGKLSTSPATGRSMGRFSDWLFEAGIGKETGSYAWRNMKQDAAAAFDGSAEYDGGFRGLFPLLSGLDKSEQRPRIHLVGHSAGSIVIGQLLTAIKRFRLKRTQISSIHLMAPACTVEFFKTHYGPYLNEAGPLKLADKIYLYNLPNHLEVIDTVSANIPLLPSYSHSLLYLVSRAYEDAPNAPVAGMQIHEKSMPRNSKRLEIIISNQSDLSKSKSHGGFDNDAATLATIMQKVLGHAVDKPPTNDELTGY